MTDSHRVAADHRRADARREFFRPRVASVSVNDNWKVPVPPTIAAVVENVNLAKEGPASVWHFDHEEECVVAATHQIRTGNRYRIGPTVKVTERSIESGFTPDDRTGYIRPDKRWHSTVTSDLSLDIFQENFELVWIVLEWMYGIEPRRAYLLTMDQLMRRISEFGEDVASGYGFTGIPGDETLEQILREHGTELLSPANA